MTYWLFIDYWSAGLHCVTNIVIACIRCKISDVRYFSDPQTLSTFGLDALWNEVPREVYQLVHARFVWGILIQKCRCFCVPSNLCGKVLQPVASCMAVQSLRLRRAVWWPRASRSLAWYRAMTPSTRRLSASRLCSGAYWSADGSLCAVRSLELCGPDSSFQMHQGPGAVFWDDRILSGAVGVVLVY